MERDQPDADADATTAPSSSADGLALTEPSHSLDQATTPPSGRYQVSSVLGRGGMGEVMLARDEQLEREVAIKRMRVTDPAPEALARFLREARIQGRLDHPAIVPVYELARDAGGHPFFVMKRLSGSTLAEVIAGLVAGDTETARRFSPQRLLRAFAEICLAIEFAHTRGIIHRDLKPPNVVLGEFGEVYVLDWGVARVVDEIDDPAAGRGSEGVETTAGSILGTPGYMSPEQARGMTDLDGRTDVYALGCILFELLTYQPLHGRGFKGLVSAVAGVDARPSVRAPEREIAPELDAICQRATAVDRAERYPSARALGDAVQSYLDGDRDLLLRKQLAEKEFATAGAALQRGDGAAERQVAIRAAARAIALDPRSRDAVDFVGRLLLQPPARVPAEVEQALDQIEDDSLYASRGLIIGGQVAWLVFLPILYWVGMRDHLYMVVAIAIPLSLIVFAKLAPRRMNRQFWFTAVIGTGLMIALLSRMLTPFWIAPSLAAVTAMGFATQPWALPAWRLVSWTLLAVLAPWFLELAGFLSKTTVITGNRVILHTAAETLDPARASIALFLYVAGLVIMGVLVSSANINERRATQRIVQLQAWQLRQLLPRARTAGEHVSSDF